MRDLLMLAYPTKKLGTVEILVEGEEKRRIDAHKSTVYALELCPNGGKLATASEKGTIIRIFNVRTCECMQELRRGSEYATIYSIAFDLNSEWLACSSDSGTVHIFGLRRG
jgi:WD40 repeat protein